MTNFVFCLSISRSRKVTAEEILEAIASQDASDIDLSDEEDDATLLQPADSEEYLTGGYMCISCKS